ncbi:MAG: hypothetical protein NVSMB47_16090 [Polyangiales bacterium]
MLLALASPSARAQGTGSGIGSGSGNVPARPAQLEKELTDLPADARVLPRGPTLPDLQHTASEASFEQTIASVRPKPGGLGSGADTSDGNLTSHLFDFDVEIPVVRQALYVGGRYGFAAARSPTQHSAKFISGQPEVFARVAHAGAADKWAVGAGFGTIFPVVTYDALDDATRLQTATPASLVGIVRPWDLSSFLDRRVTLRPWIDLRVGRNKLLAQFRQGLDVAVRSGVASQGSAAGAVPGRVGDIDLISVSTLYLGWQPTPELAIGVEAWEVYLLKTSLPISDQQRTAFALSPGFRFFYRWIEPGVSLLVPIGAPLLGAVDSYVALRVDLRVWFGR